MQTISSAIVFFLAFTLTAHAWQVPWTSAEQRANKLFVETMPLWQEYQALPTDEPDQYEVRFQLLTDISANLDTIVRDYPESSLAVELVSTGAVKGIDRKVIDEQTLPLEKEILCLRDAQSCAITEALATAQGIDDMSMRSWALANIAVVQAAAGDASGAKTTASEALATAQGIDDVSMQSMALALVLSNIAVVQAAAGDASEAKTTASEALATAQGIDDVSMRSWVLANIAAAQAAVGDASEALLMAQGIGDESIRSWALADIAAAQAAAGDASEAKTTASEALAMAQGIDDVSMQLWVLANIAAAQAAAGDASAAKTTTSDALVTALEAIETDQIGNERDRVWALASIAAAQAAVGDASEAKITASEALETARNIPRDYLFVFDRVLALVYIAKAIAVHRIGAN